MRFRQGTAPSRFTLPASPRLIPAFVPLTSLVRGDIPECCRAVLAPSRRVVAGAVAERVLARVAPRPPCFSCRSAVGRWLATDGHGCRSARCVCARPRGERKACIWEALEKLQTFLSSRSLSPSPKFPNQQIMKRIPICVGSLLAAPRLAPRFCKPLIWHEAGAGQRTAPAIWAAHCQASARG